MIEKTAQLFKMMSEPTRLSILVLLDDKELSVSDIGQQLELEQSVVSHQLQKLKSNHFVKARRDGKRMMYSHFDQHISNLIKQGLEHAMEKNEDDTI
ncbi:MAG: helix-turn-helix transcriptional regulator [Erysipelothrix sp.]|nr:helix-turn-helix transcriptional regulator [Erysipelothrix sp.]